jgi:hypothetical protein
MSTQGQPPDKLSQLLVADIGTERAHPVTVVGGVRLDRGDRRDTPDEPLWPVIRTTARNIRFEEFEKFIEDRFCGARAARSDNVVSRAASTNAIGSYFLPFPDIHAYRLLKAAAEIFLMINCGVVEDNPEEAEFFDRVYTENRERLDPKIASGTELQQHWNDYLVAVNGGGAEAIDVIPYLAAVRANLSGTPLRLNAKQRRTAELCNVLLEERMRRPLLLELIHSWWHEQGQLTRCMRAISLRFQNRHDPAAYRALAELEITPLRPLNNLLWGYVQDEQHRLTPERRAYEYEHHYGLRTNAVVERFRPADRRSRFLHAFHNLLHRTALFYRDDDDVTVIADAFPVLNAIRDTHLILSEGAHNQFGDLPWTARQEMLMEQWLLARPEFDEFLPGRRSVVYPEKWMSRVDAMKRLQGPSWGETSVRHYRDLAHFGEQLLLAVRYGNWSNVTDPNSAANFARFWREEIQWYIYALQSVTGVDLSAGMTDVRTAEPAAARFTQPGPFQPQPRAVPPGQPRPLPADSPGLGQLPSGTLPQGQRQP